ncbi:MAG: helix-turn-helix transcriptional regulator [Anaerolineaceae bacterium]
MSDSRDNQIRRTARILEIISQISNAPRYWTRRKLSDHHEISERSIQKDIELIRIKLGLELSTERNGYYFQYLPHLPITNFSLPEAITLLTAARAAQTIPGLNSADLATSIARLESIFPPKIRPFLKNVLDQLPKTASANHRQLMLALIHRAFYEQRQIRIAYRSNQSNLSLERIIEPYHIMPYGRSWHIIAYDHLRKEILQFKCDRIQHGELLDTHYSIPKEFNVEEYFGDGWGLMRGAAKEPETVCLHFNEVAGRWVTEEHWHKSQINEVQNDGSYVVRFFVGVTPEMVNWLLYYGANVEVLEPDRLRKKVKEEHRRAI